VEWNAIGTFVSKWSYPERGISLHMVSDKPGEKKKVLMFEIRHPCSYKTSKGIGIGSTESQVMAAYGKYQVRESSRAGKSLVAGSPYGGIIFDFEEGRVSSIFIGAAAE
jgi:hypothetical protein